MLKIKEKNYCFLCGHLMNYRLTGYDFFYNTTDKGFLVFKCPSCEIQQLFPVPSYKEIITFYPKDYYAYTTTTQKKSGFFDQVRGKILEMSYNSTSTKDKYYIFACIAKPLLLGLPLAHSGLKNFLDIGCGDGSILRLMKRFGWNTFGFEIGKPKRIGNIFYNIHLDHVNFESPNIKFDYIRMSHVLEHVTDPKRYLLKINQLLSDGGKFAICVPNTKSFNAWLFGKYWAALDIPRHVINYNSINLRRILEDNGFKIEKVTFNQAGSFLFSFQYLINSQFSLNLKIVDNPFLFLLFFPIDLFLGLIRLADGIAIIASKRQTE